MAAQRALRSGNYAGRYVGATRSYRRSSVSHIYLPCVIQVEILHPFISYLWRHNFPLSRPKKYF
jgi:hypothetical protein